VLALVFVGGVVAVLAIIVAQRFLPDLAERAPPQVVVAPQPTTEPAAAEPQSDVARERAALDAPPNE
jgi:hypothetical protein